MAPLHPSSAFFAHFMETIARQCCQWPMLENGPILADEEPFRRFSAILAHFMETYTRIFENGAARSRCLAI